MGNICKKSIDTISCESCEYVIVPSEKRGWPSGAYSRSAKIIMGRLWTTMNFTVRQFEV